MLAVISCYMEIVKIISILNTWNLSGILSKRNIPNDSIQLLYCMKYWFINKSLFRKAVSSYLAISTIHHSYFKSFINLIHSKKQQLNKSFHIIFGSLTYQYIRHD